MRGFDPGVDQIDVSVIDAMAGVAGDQAFIFIGTDDFSGEGQIEAVKFGRDTVLRFNSDGSGGPEMEIVLANTQPSSLNADSFIL